MPMRLSGLMSGMDTESIVSQLVEARKEKVTKAVKAQKSLKYKQDAWKDLNKQILDLYNKSVSNMRFESSFIKKTTKVSNSSVVSVITGENAMNSVQSLTVDQLAKTSFLTGSKLKMAEWAEGAEITGSTTLGDLGLTAGENANMKIEFGDGSKKSVSVTADTTIDRFVSSLREAGLTANFDANNGRIFVASKQSGAKQDFNIVATNVAGMEAVSKLGLGYKAAEISEADMNKSVTDRVQSLLNNYNNAKADQTVLTAKLRQYKDQIDARLGEGYTEGLFNGTSTIEDGDLTKLGEALDAIVKNAKENGKKPDMVKDLEGWVSSWKKDASIIKNVDKNYQGYLGTSDGKAVWNGATVNGETIEAKVRSELDAAVQKQKQDVEDAEKLAKDDPDKARAAGLPVKQAGEDAQITLNGVVYKSTKNTFEVNGLTLTVNAKTAAGEEVTITTEEDVTGVYDMIKGFIKDYSALINKMDKFYNADSAKGYEPLTDEEKEAMSDSQIEEWENKIKDSILRRDGTLGNFSSELKRIMMEGVVVNGKQMYLSNFGIGTLSYFSAPDNERNAYHIDGDPDDESTSGNPDKLKSMIANDPDTVVSFFTQLSQKLYGKMFDMMKGVEGVSSSMTAYEDKKMQTEYDDYTAKIKELEKKLADYEDKWYAKFASMETALAKMQNNASAVTSLLGG